MSERLDFDEVPPWRFFSMPADQLWNRTVDYKMTEAECARLIAVAERDGLIILQFPEQFQRWRGAARRVVVRVKVVFLGVVARKFIANAAIAPTKAPKMANSTFWCVYENAIPAMLIVRREPAAKASFVAKSDRMKLGTIIPAMNKVITTSISS
jgi:hypothetical protein